MSAGEILNPRDKTAVKDIMLRAGEILTDRPLYLAEDREFSTRAFANSAKRLDLVGVSPICPTLSDAVTRAALGMGIVASREMHGRDRYSVGMHFLTSFGSLDKPLGDDDPILCATWGQFTGAAAFNKRHRREQDLVGFFRRRKDIKRLVSPLCYDMNYSAGSVALRQTVYAPLPAEVLPANGEHYPDHTWLDTSPEEILTDQYPAGEASPTDYPAAMWESAQLRQFLGVKNEE